MLLASKHLCVATRNVVERLVRPRRVRAEPAVAPEHPWEAFGVFFQGSVLRDVGYGRDHGRPYRMWYSAIGERRREQQYVGYAESDDGVHFEKVLRREWGHGDWPETNIVYGQAFNCAAPNVHFYERARGGYRYFMAFDSVLSQHQDRHATAKVPYSRPGDRARLARHPSYRPGLRWDEYFRPNTGVARAMYVADSADGLSWEPADGRFAIPGQSDGDHTVVWEPTHSRYRVYFRDNRLDENGQRIRQVVTATSVDTVEWTEPELCLESDAIDDPRVQQIHGMPVTYRDGVYIGLVQVLEIEDEVVRGNPFFPMELGRFHVQLAVSTDGVRFHRVAERAEFFGPTDPVTPGRWDSGMVRSGGQWVLDGDRMLMYYDGRDCKHEPKEGLSGNRWKVGIGVAESPLDRFAGLTPLDATRRGHVVAEVPAEAEGLTLNCDVPPGAAIRASLRYADGCRVLPFTEDEHVPIVEGGLRVPVRWRSGGVLPGEPRPLQIRLSLEGPATVYAMNGVNGAAG